MFKFRIDVNPEHYLFENNEDIYSPGRKYTIGKVIDLTVLAIYSFFKILAQVPYALYLIPKTFFMACNNLFLYKRLSFLLKHKK